MEAEVGVVIVQVLETTHPGLVCSGCSRLSQSAFGYGEHVTVSGSPSPNRCFLAFGFAFILPSGLLAILARVGTNYVRLSYSFFLYFTLELATINYTCFADQKKRSDGQRDG